MRNAKDPRWVLLAENGDFSTIGRHSEPDDNEIAAAEAALERGGISGWIAIMSGSIYKRSVPDLVMVRALRQPLTPFDTAVRAFHQRRSVYVGDVSFEEATLAV